jgi:hypothetical protein
MTDTEVIIEPETAPPFGWIAPAADGSFEFSEEGDGLLCKLLEVFTPDNPEPIDTVAWAFGTRSPWWLRYGAVSYLGAYHLWRRREPGLPVRIVPTPADWLIDGGLALCILDWRKPVLPLLDVAGAVAPTTIALEERLREAVEKETRRRIRIGRAAA